MGLLPGGDGGIDATVGWLIGHEARAQLRAHVVHRRVLIREELEEPDAFVLAVIVEGEPKDALRSTIVGPVAEDETGAAVRGLDAPPSEDARDFDDVLLGVTAVDTKSVQLEKLARVILVDARGPAAPVFRHFVHSEPAPRKQGAERTRWCGTRRHTLRIVEIEHHGGTFGSRDKQLVETPQRARPDRFLYIRRQQKAIGALADKYVEMIRPEIDHYLMQLPLRQRGPDDRELL